MHIELDQLLADIGAAQLDAPGVEPVAFFDADHTLWAADLADVAFQLQIEERTLKAEAAAAKAARPPSARHL